MNSVKTRKLHLVRERLLWNLGLLDIELRLGTQERCVKVNIECCELLFEDFLALCGNTTIEAAAYRQKLDELKDQFEKTQRPNVRDTARALAVLMGQSSPPKLEVVK